MRSQMHANSLSATTQDSNVGVVGRAPARAHLATPGRFIWHHVRRWRWHFGFLLLSVIGAAACGIGQQYGLKLLVDAMAGTRELGGTSAVALALFLGLIAAESGLSRLTGWLACRTTVGVGVDLRLELFEHLSGQSMRYFAENLAGSLGQRITATAGNFGALTNTLVWRVVRPVVEVGGAVIIFASIDLTLTGVLLAFVINVTAGLIWFGERGRPKHRAYSGEAADVAGDLIDTISNMWTVRRSLPGVESGFASKAGSARRRRLRLGVGCTSRRPACCTMWRSGSWQPLSCRGR